MNLLSGAQLSRRWGVSVETIRRRRTAGMPTAGSSARGPVYDLGQCKAWLREQRHTRHGGNRRGTPRRDAEGDEKTGGAGSPKGNKPDSSPRSPPHGGEDPGRPGDLTQMTAVELRALALLAPEVSGLTPAAAGRMLDLIRIQERQIEVDRRRGLLLPREGVEAAWAGLIHAAVARLESLPARLAPQIAQALGAPERAQAAREILEGGIRRALAELAEAPDLAM